MPTQISSELYHVALTRVNELLPQVNDSTPANDPKMVELRHFSDIIEDSWIRVLFCANAERRIQKSYENDGGST